MSNFLENHHFRLTLALAGCKAKAARKKLFRAFVRRGVIYRTVLSSVLVAPRARREFQKKSTANAF